MRTHSAQPVGGRSVAAVCALFGVSLLVAGTVSAAPQTYRGSLQGKTLDQPAPIPIILKIDLIGVRITGRAITSMPLPGGGTLEGEQVAYQCAAKAELGNGTILNLRGHCDDMVFEGQYRIRFRSGQSWQGTFKALRADTGVRGATKEPASTGSQKTDTEANTRAVPTRSRTDCLRLKSSCLVGCPTDGPSMELLCVDRCKRRFEACAAKVP